MKAALFISLILSIGFGSQAPYIQQADRPKIAGHRGLASVFPENTLESELACMYQGADFIELDVVLTKEGQLLVSHDVYLSRVSNVADFPEFADRRKERTYQGNILNDWWISDFTVPELKKLGVKQKLVAGRLNIFDNEFKYPLMQEIIDAARAFNLEHKGSRNPDNNLVGILFESKDHEYHMNYTNTNIGDVIIDFLKYNNLESVEKSKDTVPIVLMSFYAETVKVFFEKSDLPRVQLVQRTWFPYSVQETAKYATILGSELSLLWDKETQRPSQMTLEAKANGLLIYGWVFRDDDINSLSLFNTTKSIDMFRKAVLEMQIDGIITESPDVAQAYAQAFKRSDVHITQLKVNQVRRKFNSIGHQ